MGRSKTLPGEARADDLAGHSTREVPFSRWPLLIIPLEYWREEVLHQRKGCRRYSSLKRLTCSSLAHFLLCLAPPPHPHLSFDHFPLCSLCSSHIGFIHKPCRNSGTTAAPGHLHNSLLCVDHFTLPLATGKATQCSFSIHSPKTMLLKLQPELPALPHTQPHHLALPLFSLHLLSSIICAYGQRGLEGYSPWATKNWTQLSD